MAGKASQKGTRFELKVRDMLREKTGATWERVPLSGAGAMKGDLYCKTNHYHYCIECKSFKDTVIQENLLTAKSNNFYSWWSQTVREAKDMNRKPALVFKKDRGKPMIAVLEDIPELNRFRITSDLGDDFVDVSIYLLEDWLKHKPIEEIIVP